MLGILKRANFVIFRLLVDNKKLPSSENITLRPKSSFNQKNVLPYYYFLTLFKSSLFGLLGLGGQRSKGAVEVLHSQVTSKLDDEK